MRKARTLKVIVDCKEIIDLFTTRFIIFLKVLSRNTRVIHIFLFILLVVITFSESERCLAASATIGGKATSPAPPEVTGYVVYMLGPEPNLDTHTSSWGVKRDASLLQSAYRQNKQFFWIKVNNRSCLFTDIDTIRRASDVVSPSAKLWQDYGQAEGDYWRQHSSNLGAGACPVASGNCLATGSDGRAEKAAVDRVKKKKEAALTEESTERRQLWSVAEQALKNHFGRCE